MREMAHGSIAARAWFTDKILLGLTPRQYVRSLITPFDAVAGLILAIGIPLTVFRFTYGLGATTNLTQSSPWGIWIGFDVLAGVALAAGGYTISTAVYVFGLDLLAIAVPPG